MKMRDGLYIVDRPGMYAAFVVQEGEVTSCAPILRKNLDYWKKRAKWCPTELESQPMHIDSQEMVDDAPGYW